MTSPTPESIDDSNFVCAYKEDGRPACIERLFYKEHGRKRYCVFHLPNEEKRADFEKALRDKKDFNFRGLWFPDGWNFSKYHFDVKADFSHATFNAEQSFRSVTFNGEVDFSHATFNAPTRFGGATFTRKATFSEVTFNAEVYFHRTTFKRRAVFSSATFNKLANFPSTIFEKGADFHSATFRDYLKFSGSEQSGPIKALSLDFRFATMEMPDHVSFRRLKLHACSFVTVDARQFVFSFVEWDWRCLSKEINKVHKEVEPPRKHLAVAYRNLAVNAEENHRYVEASRCRYRAMGGQRRESWENLRAKPFKRESWKNLNPLLWLYGLVSGYGEKVWQAALVLIAVWLLFALIFVGQRRAEWWRSSQPTAQTIASTTAGSGAKDRAPTLPGYCDAMLYSAGVMTLQRPEPLPASKLAKFLVLLETVFGPLQAALLALAIRRQLMR